LAKRTEPTESKDLKGKGGGKDSTSQKRKKMTISTLKMNTPKGGEPPNSTKEKKTKSVCNIKLRGRKNGETIQPQEEGQGVHRC